MRNDFAGLVPGIAAERRPPTAKDNSDEALIAKIASGNRLAMQVLFARHHARIYRFVLRLLGSEALERSVPRGLAASPPLRGTLGGYDLAVGHRPLQGAGRAAAPARGVR